MIDSLIDWLSNQTILNKINQLHFDHQNQPFNLSQNTIFPSHQHHQSIKYKAESALDKTNQTNKQTKQTKKTKAKKESKRWPTLQTTNDWTVRRSQVECCLEDFTKWWFGYEQFDLIWWECVYEFAWRNQFNSIQFNLICWINSFGWISERITSICSDSNSNR